MFSRSFIREISKLTDELFKDIAHLDIGNRAGMKINFGKTLHNHIKKVCLVQPFDMIFKIKMLKNITGVLGKASDVMTQVRSNIIWISDQFLKIVFALVEKGELRFLL